MTNSASSTFVTIEIAPGNLARIRELVAEFQSLADQRSELVARPRHSHADFEALTIQIEAAAYKLLGAVQGSLRL